MFLLCGSQSFPLEAFQVDLSLFSLVLVFEVGGVLVFGLLYIQSLCAYLPPISSFFTLIPFHWEARVA